MQLLTHSSDILDAFLFFYNFNNNYGDNMHIYTFMDKIFAEQMINNTK